MGFGGGDAAVGAGDGAVAQWPVAGAEAARDPGFDAGAEAVDAEGLILGGADGLDGVDVALGGGGLADGMGGGGEVDFSAGLFDQADDLVGEGGVAPEAVGVEGEEDVEDVVGAVLAELAVGGHGGFGVVPEDEVAGVAGDGVDDDDVSVDSLGELAAGGFLILEGGLVGAGLGFGGDGGPDGDAGGRGFVSHCWWRAAAAGRFSRGW